MNTITIKNLSTFYDFSAVARVAQYLAGDVYGATRSNDGEEVVRITKPCDTPYQCEACKDLVKYFGCGRTMLRPPQSWCYVEGLP